MTPRWLPFLPSLGLGLLGALGWWWRPPEVALLAGGGAPAWAQLAAGLATGGGALLVAALLERHVPSFRYVGRRLERALRSLRISRPEAGILALATSLAEEVAFRGVLLAWTGLIPQALVFGALHPAGLRGWSYPVFVALMGLAFGALTLWSGGLLAAIAAHAVVNGRGLWKVARDRGGGREPQAR